MNFQHLRNKHKDIVNCEVKDDTGLNDFQKLPNEYGVAIPRVGIERFRIPLQFAHGDNSVMSHDAEASMYVYLVEGKNGVNMSRFCNILQEEAGLNPVDNNFFKNILRRYRADLRDFETEDLIPESRLQLKFNYPTKQQSLKSGNWGWQYYHVIMEGVEGANGQVLINLTLHYEYSSTCPCSLSMSKQYEQAYRSGETTEGSGIASAHSQRSLATTAVTYDPDSGFSLDELISLMRIALPTETQSLVKRLDEQAFAILNGENPMFVEHASRRVAGVLESDKRIIDWNCKVEHFESLHSHNAVAFIDKKTVSKSSFLN